MSVAQADPVGAVAEVLPAADLERVRCADVVRRQIEADPRHPVADVFRDVRRVDVHRVGEAEPPVADRHLEAPRQRLVDVARGAVARVETAVGGETAHQEEVGAGTDPRVGLELELVRVLVEAHRVPILDDERPVAGVALQAQVELVPGRVLLVEDDIRIANFVAKGLRENSYAVDTATDGETGLYQTAINEYDVIILDVMLPKKDGFTVCRELRETNIKTPILMLTARDAIEDKITGLDFGADDYLTKPFAFNELLARIRALLRRNKEIRPAKIVISDLEIDTTAQRIRRSGKEISLTTKEYALLEYLARERGRVVGRGEIAEHVWDESFDAFSNLIEVYIKRLRSKMDEGFAVQLIHTRRGAGYILDENV